MAQLALRWILMNDAVSVVIPGARTPAQAASKDNADGLAPLGPDALAAIDELYKTLAENTFTICGSHGPRPCRLPTSQARGCRGRPRGAGR